MIISQIVKAKDFAERSEVNSDGKHRVALTRVKLAGKRYRVYENAAGQVLLDPVVTVPAAEAWLFKDEAALESVRRGLRQSAQGKVTRKKRAA